jgi:hypothetical protein
MSFISKLKEKTIKVKRSLKGNDDLKKEWDKLKTQSKHFFKKDVAQLKKQIDQLEKFLKQSQQENREALQENQEEANAELKKVEAQIDALGKSLKNLFKTGTEELGAYFKKNKPDWQTVRKDTQKELQYLKNALKNTENTKIYREHSINLKRKLNVFSRPLKPLRKQKKQIAKIHLHRGKIGNFCLMAFK